MKMDRPPHSRYGPLWPKRRILRIGPWILGTQQMNWLISVLVVHRLLRFGAIGFRPPQITARGLPVLNSRADLRASGDQQ